MKKYVAVATAVVFLLGFAAASFAIHAEIPAETQAVVAKSQTQITLGGEVRARGEFRNNIRDFNDDAVDRDAYYDMRVRLAVEAKITPNTMAKFHIQSGNADNADNRVWGTYDPAPGAKGSYNYGNGNAGDVRILEAWVLHQGTGLLGVPAFVKVGHMPIIVGTGTWLNHTYWGDDALLFGVDPMKEMHIVLGTVKFKEGNLALNDDGTAYVLLFNYDFDKKSSIGADVTYVDHQNSFQLTGGVPAGNQNGVDVNFWNVGVNGKFGIDIFSIYGEANFQFGDISGLPGGVNDQDFKGYAFKVGTNFDIKPVTLGLEFAWGSGDSDLADEDVKTFVTTQGNEQHYTYVYDYRTPNAAGNVGGGLQNTWYIKADAKMDFTKDFSGYLALYYLQADKASRINLGTTASPRLTNGTDKDIGLEIDAKFTWKIDRNLQYWVEGGYLFAGDFWQTAGGDPDDAYAVRHGISVSF